MPTPLEILIDPLSSTLIAIYIALISLDAIFPAQKLAKVKGWKPRAIITFFGYVYISTYLPMVWDAYLLPYQLLDISALNPYLAAFIGLLVFEFFLYIWHREMHNNRVLWRVLHQFHHSAERLDSYGAFYFSSLDIIGFTFLGSLSLVLLVGLSPEAVTLYLYGSMFIVIFQHTNIKTPVWLGYIIQCPESHSVHHSKNFQASNYSDLPIFDILFGTFQNPINFSKETGFYHGASRRVVDMLLCRDVSEPKTIEAQAQANNR